MILLAVGAPLRAGDAGARVCVEATVDGRPLSDGLLNLSPGHDLVRLRGGRACAALGPGGYALSVAPGSSLVPFGLIYEGLPGAATDYRLIVNASGSAGVFDASGRRRLDVSGKPLRVAYAAPEPRPATLEGRMTFPDAADADLEREPALLVLSYGGSDGRGAPRQIGLWLSGRPSSGTLAFMARVPEGKLVEAVLLSRRWAVVEAVLSPRLELKVERSVGSLRGTVRTPDGRPLHPSLGPLRTNVAVLELLVHRGPYYTQAAADEDGAYEFPAVAPGWHPLFTEYRVSGPRGAELPHWSVPPGAWQFMENDKTVEVALEPWAKLRVGRGNIPLKPSTDHVVIGVRAGTRLPEQVASLFGPGVPISLRQTSSGTWAVRFNNQPFSPEEDDGFRVSTGTFDFYLLRRVDGPLPFVHLLRARETVRLGERAAASLRMGGPYSEGPCALSGAIVATTRVEPASRGREPGLVDPLIVPRVTLFRGNRWIATAFGAMSPEVERAVLTADERGLEKLLTGRRWSYAISGLPAGRYRAVVSSFGMPDRESEISLTIGSPTRLDVDFGAAPN